MGLVLSLVAFVLGSNHCMLSARDGQSRMHCVSLPEAETSDCCHGDAPSETAPASRTCCIDPAPVPSQAALDSGAPILPLHALATDLDGGFLHGEDSSPEPSIDETPPPRLIFPALLSSRAPPLV